MGPRSASAGKAARFGGIQRRLGFEGGNRPDRTRPYKRILGMSQRGDDVQLGTPLADRPPCVPRLRPPAHVWQAVRIGAVAQPVRAWDS